MDERIVFQFLFPPLQHIRERIVANQGRKEAAVFQLFGAQPRTPRCSADGLLPALRALAAREVPFEEIACPVRAVQAPDSNPALKRARRTGEEG